MLPLRHFSSASAVFQRNGYFSQFGAASKQEGVAWPQLGLGQKHRSARAAEDRLRTPTGSVAEDGSRTLTGVVAGDYRLREVVWRCHGW